MEISAAKPRDSTTQISLNRPPEHVLDARNRTIKGDRPLSSLAKARGTYPAFSPMRRVHVASLPLLWSNLLRSPVERTPRLRVACRVLPFSWIHTDARQ